MAKCGNAFLTLFWLHWWPLVASLHHDVQLLEGERVASAVADDNVYPDLDGDVAPVAFSLVQENAFSVRVAKTGSATTRPIENAAVPDVGEKVQENAFSVRVAKTGSATTRPIENAAVPEVGEKVERPVGTVLGSTTTKGTRTVEEDILAVIVLFSVFASGIYYWHWKKNETVSAGDTDEDDEVFMQAMQARAKFNGFQLYFLIFGMCLLVFNLVVALVLKPEFANPSSLQELTWEPYWVLNVIIISMWLMAWGYPSDLVLTGASASCCFLGIITLGDYLAGLSNSGVVAVALLCIISKAIDKTSALNGIMGSCLGSPAWTSMAIFRLAFPVVTLGAILNNTPLVAVMIPIVNDWTAKQGLEVSHFMMPLSFMAMLSACLTTFGSSTNLLAVDLVPQAGIEVFDLMPAGLAIVVAGVSYCALFAPILLPGKVETALSDTLSTEAEKALEAGFGKQVSEEDGGAKRYVVHFVITDGPLIGRAPIDCGLQACLPLPAKITVSEGLVQPFCMGDEFAVHGATADDIAAIQAIPGLSFKLPWSQHRTWDHQKRYTKSLKSEEPTRRRLANPVRRWVAAALGGGWVPKQRPLYEVVVPVSGLALGDANSRHSSWELTKLQAALSSLSLTLVAAKGVDLHGVRDKESLSLKGGEVLLVESVGGGLSKRSEDVFGMVVPVQDGVPPEGVRMSPLDPMRAPFTVIALVLCIVLSALRIAPLDAAATLVALVLVLAGTLDSREFFDAINGRVLLTVAASFGIGAAFMKTGLASMLATSVLYLSEGYGTYASMSAVVGMALMLGVIVSNNTTVILLAPMTKDICERQGLDLKMMMIAVIYAANLSFATPFSYQTNMMVMPHGRYVFMDYIRFGVPMMLICGGVAVVTTTLVWGPTPV